MTDLRERYEWKKVEAPKTWRPRHNGEELVGFYGGKSVKNGRFGQYEVIIVHVPQRGSFMLSGVRIVQLADAAGLDVGWPVRVVWGGYKPLETEEGEEPRKMKLFDLYVAEGEPLSAEDVPKVKGVTIGRTRATVDT